VGQEIPLGGDTEPESDNETSTGVNIVAIIGAESEAEMGLQSHLGSTSFQSKGALTVLNLSASG
jgi:hypothetical protein